KRLSVQLREVLEVEQKRADAHEDDRSSRKALPHIGLGHTSVNGDDCPDSPSLDGGNLQRLLPHGSCRWRTWKHASRQEILDQRVLDDLRMDGLARPLE